MIVQIRPIKIGKIDYAKLSTEVIYVIWTKDAVLRPTTDN